MEIRIPSAFVRLCLWFSQFVADRYFVVVCKGYGDDWEQFTGLYWDEDKDLELSSYNNYHVWINVSAK